MWWNEKKIPPHDPATEHRNLGHPARAGWSSPINRSTSTARQLICSRFTERIKGCLLQEFSSLMPRGYGRLPSLQDQNGGFFHTFNRKGAAPKFVLPRQGVPPVGVGVRLANYRFHLVFFPAACFLSGRGFGVVAAVAWIAAIERGVVNFLPHPPFS
jgi:hypothetical protein